MAESDELAAVTRGWRLSQGAGDGDISSGLNIAAQPSYHFRMDDHGSRISVNGRARGAIVGSLIALAWAFYGSSILGQRGRLVTLVVFAVLTAGMIAAAVGQLRHAHRMPPATPAQRSAGKRAWRWFWINLMAEIVLLNVAIAVLGTDQRIYWIAAISAIVGLHFLPMAVFFRTRSYWFAGAAMLGGAIVAALFIASRPASAGDIAYLEALANAVILWMSVGAGMIGIGAMMRSGRQR